MRKEQGFTLIELMIVVIVIGILTAIALPSYQSYLRRSACEDGKATLMGAANLMERYRAQNNTYATATTADLGVYQASPVDGSQKNFDIVLSDQSDTGYTLTASITATGALASRTGTLVLNSSGAKTGTDDLINAWGSCKDI